MERADLESWKAREVTRLLSLVETERRYYQDILATLPVGLLVIGSDLTLISSNRAARQILQLHTPGRLEAGLPAIVLDEAQQVFRTGAPRDPLTAEVLGRKIRFTVQPIRAAGNENAPEALLTIEDLNCPVTLQSPAAALGPAPNQGGEVCEELDAIVWRANLSDFRFTFVSGGAERILGFSGGHWTDQPDFWTERIYPADRDAVIHGYEQAIAAKAPFSCEFRAQTTDGRLLWLRETARIGEEFIFGVSTDITARRQVDERWVRSERNSAAIKLAGKLAHDLNNILMITTGYSDELLHGLPLSNPLRSDVEEIVAANNRLAGLTNELVAHARHQTVSLRPVDLGPVLSAFSEDLQLPLEPVAVMADAAQLKEVLGAFAARAAEAGATKLRIAVRPVEVFDVMSHSTLKPGRYIEILVMDDGRTISADQLGLMFEAFLPREAGMSKPGRPETMVGLARAYAAVRLWGGDISVSSSSQGSSVQILCIPAEAPAHPEEQTSTATPIEEPHTILIVEDENGIRALMRKILRRQGYQVLEASSGDAALALCAQHPGAIHLLVTDVIMPRMTGRELAERLRSERKGFKVLYVSGYTDDPTLDKGEFPEGTAFLQKPFTLGSLLDKVRELLEAPVKENS